MECHRILIIYSPMIFFLDLMRCFQNSYRFFYFSTDTLPTSNGMSWLKKGQRYKSFMAHVSAVLCLRTCKGRWSSWWHVHPGMFFLVYHCVILFISYSYHVHIIFISYSYINKIHTYDLYIHVNHWCSGKKVDPHLEPSWVARTDRPSQKPSGWHRDGSHGPFL